MKIFRFITIALTLLLIGCKPLSLSHGVAVVDLNIVAKTLGRDDLIVKNVKSANDNLNRQLELKERVNYGRRNRGRKRVARG